MEQIRNRVALAVFGLFVAIVPLTSAKAGETPKTEPTATVLPSSKDRVIRGPADKAQILTAKAARLQVRGAPASEPVVAHVGPDGRLIVQHRSAGKGSQSAHRGDAR